MDLKQPYLLMSDLHLSEATPALTRLFFLLLEHFSGKCQAVYILGDLFEVWIGDDEISEFHQAIYYELKKFTAHTPIYFIHGNRDFLMGEAFSAKTGVHYCAEVSFVTWFERIYLLSHGDLWCTDDLNYIRLRTWLRKDWVQRILRALPYSIRNVLGQKARAKSFRYTQSKGVQAFDIQEKNIFRYFDEFQISTIIHGHTHAPKRYLYQRKYGQFERWVLRDWRGELGGFFLVNEQGIEAFCARVSKSHGLMMTHDHEFNHPQIK